MGIQHTNGLPAHRAICSTSLALRSVEGPEKVLQLTATQAEYAEVLFNELSPAERRVLQELVNGRALPAIASLHHVSVTTVRTLTARMFAKLGVTSQLQAACIAMSCGGYKPDLRALVPHLFGDDA